MDVVSGLFGLPGDGRNDFFPACPKAGVRGGAIVFDDLVKCREIIIGDQGKHVVFHMVVHVEVEEPVDDVGEERSGVESVIEDVFGQPGVLGEAVKRHQPSAENIGKAD